MVERKRSVQLGIRITEKAEGQLKELVRVLSARLGTPVTKAQAIEASIDSMLENLSRNREQGRLI